jgi:hypothetical protein
MPGAFQYRHFGNLATIGRLAAVVELRKLQLWGAPPSGSGALLMRDLSPAAGIVPLWR